MKSIVQGKWQLKKFLAVSSITTALFISIWTPSYAQPSIVHLNKVYVIVYKASSGDDGIHSIIDNNGINTVLMFDSEAAAKLYASQLKKLPKSTIESIDADEMIYFCRTQNYICQFIPNGITTIPPTENYPVPSYKPQ